MLIRISDDLIINEEQIVCIESCGNETYKVTSTTNQTFLISKGECNRFNIKLTSRMIDKYDIELDCLPIYLDVLIAQDVPLYVEKAVSDDWKEVYVVIFNYSKEPRERYYFRTIKGNAKKYFLKMKPYKVYEYEEKREYIAEELRRMEDERR